MKTSTVNPLREMAETAPAAAAPPAKAPKKKSAAKAKKAGPGVGELIVKAVSASKERSGVSLAALKKALAAGGYDVEKNVSGYVCNHGSLRVGNETLRPLGVAMGNVVSVTRV